MASTALLRRLPSPALSSSPIFHPLRRSRAMSVASISHFPLQGASLSSCTRPSRSLRAELSGERLHFETEEDRDAKEVTGWKGLGFAVAMACPVLLLAPHAATAMESGEILRLSAAELDPGTAKLAITVLGPLFAAFNLLFIVRIVMSWYPQLPVGKFPFSIAYAPTEPVLGPTRRLIPPVGGVDVAPVIWVALMSFLNETLLGQQGLLVLLSQQQP